MKLACDVELLANDCLLRGGCAGLKLEDQEVRFEGPGISDYEGKELEQEYWQYMQSRSLSLISSAARLRRDDHLHRYCQ